MSPSTPTKTSMTFSVQRWRAKLLACISELYIYMGIEMWMAGRLPDRSKVPIRGWRRNFFAAFLLYSVAIAENDTCSGLYTLFSPTISCVGVAVEECFDFWLVLTPSGDVRGEETGDRREVGSKVFMCCVCLHPYIVLLQTDTCQE